LVLPRVGNKWLWRRNTEAFQPGAQGDSGVVMVRLVMRRMRSALRRWSRSVCALTVRRRLLKLLLSLSDQDHQVRFKTLTVFCGGAQQGFDRAALAAPEGAVPPPGGKGMQKGYWLWN